MAKNKKHSTPSTDLLRRYVAGTLSPVEQYQLEKSVLQNQEIDDTLEGLQALKAANIDEKAALEDLTQRLRQRVRKSERKLLPYYYASAAAVVLTVGLSWWLIQKEELPMSADTVSSTILLEKERPIVKPKAAPAAIESQPSRPSAPIADARKPSLSNPSSSPQIRESTDADKIQQAEPPVSNLALEEKKSEIEAPPTVSEAAPTQDAQPTVTAQPKMLNQSRVASAPAPVQSTQDLDTVRVVVAKAKKATQVINGAVSSLPQGGAKKENVFTLQGKVVDAITQEPLLGATLTFDGRSRGVTTDAEGKFALSDVQKNDKLTISSIGFKTIQMTIKDSLIPPILLQEDNQTLSEVVTTGHQKNNQTITEAAPKNGWKKYKNYLENSTKAYVAQNPQAPKGEVRLTFVLTASGELTDFKPLTKRDTKPLLVEEAIRIVKSGDSWIPGLKNGQLVPDKILLRFRFE